MLGWLNKLLGVIFALLKCALIVGLVIMAFNSINGTFHLISDETLSNSLLYGPIRDTANNVFPYLKGLLTFK